MNPDLFGAIGAFIIGLVLSFLNYKISEYFLKSRQNMFSYVSVIRQAVQVAYVLILFFAAKYTPWDRTYLLIGGVLGITLPMFFFTYRLLKTNSSMKTEQEDQQKIKEGEKNG